MRTRTRTVLLLRAVAVSTVLAASTQAAVTLSSAVNGASYLNSILENGKLAPGVLFVAFGSGMGPASIVRAVKFPLPKDLGGTSIRATVGGTAVDCIMLYTTASQVAAILPSNTPVGTGTMTVTYNGDTSAPFQLRSRDVGGAIPVRDRNHSCLGRSCSNANANARDQRGHRQSSHQRILSSFGGGRKRKVPRKYMAVAHFG